MTGTHRLGGHRGRSRSAPLLTLLALALAACGDVLEVQNPNNVPDDALLDPRTGVAMANGVQSLTAQGVVGASLPYVVITDEMAWIGSRDGFRELDQGKISNAYNEFTDGFYRDYTNGNLGEARWMADEGIKILEQQDADGSILDRRNLARLYLYGAIAYVTIANIYDDWALSDRRTAAPPTGPDNMGGYYDTAINYLTKGLAIAQATKDDVHVLAIQAMRARANFDRAIWETVNKPARRGAGVVNPASPYVTAAVADANAALTLMGATDYEYRFTFNAGTGSSGWGAWVNSRQENRLGGTYVELHASRPTWNDKVLLTDPIDNTKASPIVDRFQKRFKAEATFAGYTVVSRREMHLILAEAALAAGNVTGGGNTFQTHINNLRALDKYSDGTAQTPWTGAAGQPTARAMLEYSRQANLFLQTRRLSDHYRFDIASREWLAGAQVLTGAMFFPIPATECLSNPNIGRANCST